MSIKEQWRRIGGTVYEVSDRGRVRSLDRWVQQVGNDGSLVWQTYAGKILSASLNGVGYKGVCIYRNRVGRTQQIHTLVAKAFLGPRPEGLVIDHVDRNRVNNSADNLRYITQRENTAHLPGAKGLPCSLLHIESGVRYHADSQNKLACLLGLPQSSVHAVVNGKQLSTRGFTTTGDTTQ